MKAYTDLEQSKKLAEILPRKSADMYWMYVEDQELEKDFWKVETIQLVWRPFSMHIPCWSLGALLGVLPSVIKRNGKRMFLTLGKEEHTTCTTNPPIGLTNFGKQRKNLLMLAMK